MPAQDVFTSESPARLGLRVQAHLQAPLAARESLNRLSSALDPAAMSDVRLLVSELVTNCIMHGELRPADEITLEAEVSDELIRVEVKDPGSGFGPRDLARDREGVSGWGLFLIDRLADRWGADARDETLVWFEIDRV
jgi:anti-sigma regulatory factor (Ser/Thr protein kinase)